MCQTRNCYKTCINKEYLLSDALLKHAQEIVSHLPIKANIGRHGIEFERGLNGIGYLLKTGIPWKALPRCFGSSSAVHRLFQKLRMLDFFKLLWHQELQNYDCIQGLRLELQVGDCSHVKAPLGREKTGPSPVDRKKLGTKRSIIVDKNGIVIGCALGAGNRHDSVLFAASIQSIPSCLKQPKSKVMELDCAYDSKAVRVVLFNYYYVPKITRNKRNSKKTLITSPPQEKRWIVESAHSWMNRFRRLLVRFEKRANNYIALMQFAISIIVFNKLGI